MELNDFQFHGVLLIWIIISRKGPTELAAAAGGGCLDIFSLVLILFLPRTGRWSNLDFTKG